MSNVLVILGHPSVDSLSSAIADKYCAGASNSGNEIRRINVGELTFSPFLESGYSKEQLIEPDIISAQNDIKWAEHLVFIYPTWWASPPALLQAFIERTFLPGFAFKYKKSKRVVAWDKYLTGKTARVISTMDSPPLYYRWYIGDPGYKIMKDVLTFCGISSVKKTYFGSVKLSSGEKRKAWLDKVYSFAIASQ